MITTIAASTDPPLSILVADGQANRVKGFRVQGSGYFVRQVTTQVELEKSFNEPKTWDLVLHSLYLGKWSNNELESVETLSKAWNAKKLIYGVVCTSSMSNDARKFMSALRLLGVPSIYIPYDYLKPYAPHTPVALDSLPELKPSRFEVH